MEKRNQKKNLQEDERIDKSQYRDRVKLEKKKLNKQVSILLFAGFLVSIAFYITLVASNPHVTTS